MNQLRTFADARLIDGCVFCDSRLAELTRDHAPSRVLLDSPYPDNLPIVDACRDCNNGFSLDEEYVACLVECAAVGSTNPDKMSRDVVRRILNRGPALRARLEQARRIVNDVSYFVPEKTRVDNIVAKLARAHAAFELSTPLRDKPARIDWWVLPLMESGQRDRYDAAHVHHLIGEVGSRAMQRMVVVQSRFVSDTGELVTRPLFLSDWVEVQEGRYRYLAFDDLGASTVKIVIGEYLACEVTWSWDDDDEASEASFDGRPSRGESKQLNLDFHRNREAEV